MIIYEIIQYILIALGGGLLGYQMLLSFLALKGKDIKDFRTKRKRKFVVVIPAHNEEQVIAKTLYSLFGLVYPKNLYQIVVVADNCTDRTARIARKLGAKVLERTHKEKRGKGYALRWAFDQILDWEEDYDGVIVLDSDSLISGNYLEVMNFYLENGSKVIQSSDLVLPQPGVWSSESIRIGFLLYNYVKPMGRKVLGLDMGLRGNGMCFAPEILKKYTWQAWSLTEDIEYGLSLLLEGVKIDFAPEANLWAQMPVQAENAESQRTRWEMGRYPIIKKYASKLLKRFFTKRSLRNLDTLVDLITPPLVNLLLFVLVMLTLNLILWLVGFVPLTFTWIWLGITVMGLLHLFIGMLAAGADWQMYKSIFYIPVYAFWKVKVYVTTWLKGSERQWIRTTRDAGKLK
ncbi:MAG: glycosyltransferase family 2 protein [Balneolaceae bacterium]